MTKRFAGIRRWLDADPFHKVLGAGFVLFPGQFGVLCWTAWFHITRQNFQSAIIPAFGAGLILGLLGITYTVLIALRERRAAQARHEAAVAELLRHLSDQEVDGAPPH